MPCSSPTWPCGAKAASILPNYDVVIFDEAHTLEAVAGDHLGLSDHQRPGRVTRLRQALQRPHESRAAGASSPARGAATGPGMPRAGRALLRRRRRAGWQAQSGGNGRVRQPKIVDNASERGPGAARRARSAATARSSRSRTSGRTSPPPPIGWTDWPLAVEQWRCQRAAGGRLLDRGRGRPPAAADQRWPAAPLDVGPILRDELFAKVPSVIMTSATLATAGRFDFFNRASACCKPMRCAWAAPSTTSGRPN